ncbi:MAG TPA: DoxX family protein [Polyangiaceae bacterium]
MTTQLDPKDQLASVSDLALAAAGPHSSIARRLAGSTLFTGDVALLLLRVAFGASLSLTHGLAKLQGPALFLSILTKRGFPLPVFFGWAAILSEFAGGLLLALGAFTRPAAAFIAITLSVAAFDIHSGDPFAKRELALAYAVVALSLLIGGPGRFSLDRRLWDSRKERS